MPSVIALHDAAFYTIIRQKWKNALLHSLLVDTTYEIFLTCPTREGERYSNAALVNRPKFAQLVMAICNQILMSDSLPNTIKNNLALAFYEIAFEIETFIYSLISSLKNVDAETIAYFLQRIIISQDGLIDKKNSLLKIIGDSKFAYKFSNTVLIRNCIEKPDLVKLSEQVLAKEKCQPNWKRTIASTQEAVNSSLSIMILPTVHTFVNDQIIFRFQTENFTKVLLYGNNVNVINLIYNNEKPAEKQDFLLRLSYYAFKLNLLFSASFVVFLYENMDAQAWQDILRRNFHEVFWILLSSRRYRHYMLTWFRQAIPTMSYDTYVKMIYNEAWISPTLVLQERFSMETLFKKIWDETPDTFKHEHLIRQAVIKNIVYVIQNVEILEYVLRGYDMSIRAQMLKQTILHYLITQADDNLPTIQQHREELTKVRINLGLPESVLVGASIEELKYYVLAMDASKAGLIGYQRRASLHADPYGFKANLLNEKGFVEMFLLKHWQTKNIRSIFLWCAEFNNKACSQYFMRLDEKIFERVYEKVLFEVGDINIADRGFGALQICIQKVRRIKVNVLSKPEVRKHLLINYFRRGYFHFIGQWHLFYISNDNGIGGFLRELFATDYAKEALWELILYIEGSLTVMQQMDQVNVFRDFCEILVFKYLLAQVIRESLMEHGHPNVRNAPITYQDRAPTPQELPELRKVVDFRYRSLLAMLHGSSTMSLFNRRLVTVTDVSVVLAQAVQLNIPVVF